jgi:hypothetical protein
MLESSDLPKDIGLVWLRRLLRRGRKYRMKVFAVAQEFEVNALEDRRRRRAEAGLYGPISRRVRLPGSVEHQGQDPD